MENKFKYTLDNKRYHTWNYYLNQKFGEKVFKVALNGGFTCPNIDGTKGYGGCTYCLSGSGDFAGNPEHSGGPTIPGHPVMMPVTTVIPAIARYQES